MRWHGGAIVVGALIGCGPVAGDADDGGSSGRGHAPTEPTTTPGATTSGATATTSADTSTGSTTSDSAITTTADDDDCGESCCSFIVCPDTQPLTECDLWSQNCPRGGKCVPYANDGGDLWNSSRCSTVSGTPDQVGDACVVTGTGVSGLDSCDLGLVCLWVDSATNMGTCVPLCIGTEANPSCGGDSTACTVAFEGDLPVCLPGCDPLEQDCPEGAGCYRGDGDAFVCGDTIEPVIPVDQPCDLDWRCGGGALCITADLLPTCEGEACCTAICDATAIEPCGPERVCAPLFESSSAGYCTAP